jgi:hemoglobin
VAESIFNRYGGFAKVSRIVSDFYRGVLGHPVLAPYFAHVDMPTLIDHQTKFMATVMGGPASFTNEHLARVHAPHHIDGAAFAALVVVLRETLEDHDLDETDIALVVREVQARRPYIVVGDAT